MLFQTYFVRAISSGLVRNSLKTLFKSPGLDFARGRFFNCFIGNSENRSEDHGYIAVCEVPMKYFLYFRHEPINHRVNIKGTWYGDLAKK